MRIREPYPELQTQIRILSEIFVAIKKSILSNTVDR
jgi:hypothetical protein